MKIIAKLNSKYSFFVGYFPPLEDSAGFFGKEKAKQKRGRISAFYSVSEIKFLLMTALLSTIFGHIQIIVPISEIIYLSNFAKKGIYDTSLPAGRYDVRILIYDFLPVTPFEGWVKSH